MYCSEYMYNLLKIVILLVPGKLFLHSHNTEKFSLFGAIEHHTIFSYTCRSCRKEQRNCPSPTKYMYDCTLGLPYPPLKKNQKEEKKTNDPKESGLTGCKVAVAKIKVRGSRSQNKRAYRSVIGTRRPKLKAAETKVSCFKATTADTKFTSSGIQIRRPRFPAADAKIRCARFTAGDLKIHKSDDPGLALPATRSSAPRSQLHDVRYARSQEQSTRSE